MNAVRNTTKIYIQSISNVIAYDLLFLYFSHSLSYFVSSSHVGYNIHIVYTDIMWLNLTETNTQSKYVRKRYRTRRYIECFIFQKEKERGQHTHTNAYWGVFLFVWSFSLRSNIIKSKKNHLKSGTQDNTCAIQWGEK